MRQAQALQVRKKVTGDLAKAMAKALGPFLGRIVTQALLGQMNNASRPLVLGARNMLLKSANVQYKDFLAGRLALPAPVLDRFNEDSWAGTFLKVTVTEEPFSEDHLGEVLRKGDLWARDAERGALIDYARRDARIDRWARIDPQPPSCPFCTVLISRGAVYKSKNSAGVEEMAKFHTGCTCVAVLVGKGQKDSFEGVENRDAALAEYEAAAKVAKSTSLEHIIRAMKENRGADKDGSVKKETDQDAKSATAQALSDQSAKLAQAQARRKALDTISPKGESAKAYKESQVRREDQLITELGRQIETLKGTS